MRWNIALGVIVVAHELVVRGGRNTLTTAISAAGLAAAPSGPTSR
jgi:hypothetical protein